MYTKKLNSILTSFVIILSCGFSLPVFSADLPVVQADKSVVVFYRIKKMKGGAIRFEINESGKGSLGFLSNGTKIQKELEPGSHIFTVRTPSLDGEDSITINAEAGKTYYVQGKILWGWPAGRPKFEWRSDSEAQSDLAKIK